MAPPVPLRRLGTAAQPPAAPSAARAKLADKIKTRDEDDARLAELAAALDRAHSAVYAARERRDTAAAAIDQARATDAAATTTALINDRPPAAPTLPAARRAKDDAEDAVLAAEAARSRIEAEFAKLQRTPDARQYGVALAIAELLQTEGAPQVTELVAELDDLHRRLIDRTLALRAILSAGGFTKWINEREFSPAYEAAVFRFESAPCGWDITLGPRDRAASAGWQNAIAALSNDAEAPLPVVP